MIHHASTLSLVALIALASCCPKARAEPNPGPAFELGLFEKEMMWLCLSARAGAGYDNYESPRGRLEYCIAQIKNYRNMTR